MPELGSQTASRGETDERRFIDALPPAEPLASDLSNGTVQTVAVRCSWGGELTASVTPNYTTAKHVSLFVPGFTGSKEDFLSFFPHLIDAAQPSESRAFMAFSQRGQADSARPAGDNDYALEDFVHDAQEVLVRIGADKRPVDVIGHSFGGIVARRLALASPSLVRSLTLLSSGAKPIAQTSQAKAWLQTLRTFGSTIIYKSKFPKLGDEPQQDPDIEMYRVRAHRTSLHNLLSIAAILADYDDVTDALHAAGIPVSIMFGEDDPVWPHDTYNNEAERLGITPVTFPGAGHSAQIDTPDALAQALCNFWSKVGE
ncbi:alpha/beta fold hydrolase [Bifidobacterium aquikefiricola]|uniref:Alpha/beta hydrolase n=1 Tax=Bifidobacterium aquikefiricola TaxID=3059038 RepID=A0AB39U6S5_9BIFI